MAALHVPMSILHFSFHVIWVWGFFSQFHLTLAFEEFPILQIFVLWSNQWKRFFSCNLNRFLLKNIIESKNPFFRVENSKSANKNKIRKMHNAHNEFAMNQFAYQRNKLRHRIFKLFIMWPIRKWMKCYRNTWKWIMLSIWLLFVERKEYLIHQTICERILY